MPSERNTPIPNATIPIGTESQGVISSVRYSARVSNGSPVVDAAIARNATTSAIPSQPTELTM